MAGITLSPAQDAIVTAAVTGGSFRSASPAERKKCIACNSKGLLRRDAKDADLWYPTDRAAERHAATTPASAQVDTLGDDPLDEGAVAAASPMASAPVVAAMSRRLDFASSLLDEGDVMAARRLADMVYKEAKLGGEFSAKAHLRESLEACHRVQAGALSIEVKAKMLLAEEWERAGAEGKILKGRPKSVPDENAFTAAEAGLTRKELHEAKKLLDAERKQPGIAERAIAARLAQGLEPTRASLRHAIGTRSATKQERGDNLYQTPPEAMHVLLALEEFSPTIWEPACGRGAISAMLEAAGYAVVLSDLVDYATTDANGELQSVVDFRETKRGDGECHDIVTNPPYGEAMNSFIAHALRVHKPQKMALLLNSNAYFGFEDPDRVFIMETCPPARRYAFSRRLPMMHRDGWDGPKASSQMNTEWFVWERQADGSYGSTTVSRRVDWAAFMPAVEPESEDG